MPKSKLLLTAELISTLETILIYCPNKSVKKQAEERYIQLLKQNKEDIKQPPLGDFVLKDKIYKSEICK